MTAKSPFAPGSDEFVRLTSALSPILLFAIIILSPIPHTASRMLSAYSLPLFAVVGLLYFAGFQLPARWRWLAAACLTMALHGMSLSFLWHSGYSDDKIIGGLLPFRDGFDYFNGADWILGGGLIRSINEGAAWRPLYPGFLAALLWITGRHLQWALAIQVGLGGFCLGLAALHVRNRWGAAPASIFATLLYFYIQPLIGTAYTESLGLALGCLAFVLLLAAATANRFPRLIAALLVLMLAVSVRAGAFFIFPALVLWSGWAWRQGRRFTAGYAALALVVVVTAYAVLNTAFSRLIVEPGGFPFGNFAFTLYGQVNGGAGYHKAFEDLGVRDPRVILRAAEGFFLAHPIGFAVGAAKAYRDFLSPLWGVFGFGLTLADLGLAICLTMLLLYGLYLLARSWALVDSSLLLAAILGVLLSVPFLPPIDGGIRIYASTMPFIYVIPAVALAKVVHLKPVESVPHSSVASTAALALVLGFLTVVLPVGIRFLAPKPVADAPACPADQMSYAAVVSPGSFIDLVPDGAGRCGTLPQVCLSGFQSYAGANDPSDAAVFAHLAAAAEAQPVRLFAGNDLVAGRPYLFVASSASLPLIGRARISGCATETQIRGRPSTLELRTMQVTVGAD